MRDGGPVSLGPSVLTVATRGAWVSSLSLENASSPHKMLSHTLQTLGGRQVLVIPAGRAPSGAQEGTSPSASEGSSGGNRGSAGVPSCLAPGLA